MSDQANLPTICVAGTLLAASLVLAFFFIAPGADGALVARGGVGPATWPKTMLFGIACCAAIILLRELFRLSAASSPRRGGEGGASDYDNRRAALGIALLLLFGIAVPFIGFALATVVFLAVWLPAGGLRKPLTIGLLSVLGTVSLLYIFAGLSKMPLDRGIGFFDGVTVALYRLLGIY